MAVRVLRPGHTETILINASGDSDVLVLEPGSRDLSGIMYTSHGTFSATSVAVKATLNASAKSSLTDGSWKTVNADISAGVQEVMEPWKALHFDTTSYVSGGLIVHVLAY